MRWFLYFLHSSLIRIWYYSVKSRLLHFLRDSGSIATPRKTRYKTEKLRIETLGTFLIFPGNKLLLISINFTHKTSHSCLKDWYFPMFSRFLENNFRFLSNSSFSASSRKPFFRGENLGGKFTTSIWRSSTAAAFFGKVTSKYDSPPPSESIRSSNHYLDLIKMFGKILRKSSPYSDLSMIYHGRISKITT